LKKGTTITVISGFFLLLGLFMMPMRRVNPRENLVDNPFGWGLFGFGLSSLLMGTWGLLQQNRQEMESIYQVTLKNLQQKKQSMWRKFPNNRPDVMKSS
jgi:hypothetical protein